MKKGDNYIHFTKYGGVNKGIIAEVGEILKVDLINKCTYVIPTIRTHSGICLRLDGSDGQVFPIFRSFTEEENDNLNKAFKAWAKIKSDKIKHYEGK